MDLAVPNTSPADKRVSPLGDLLAPLSRSINPVSVLAVLVIYLVWTNNTTIGHNQQAMQEQLSRVYAVVESTRDEVNSLKANQATSERLFRLICLNTAERDADRRACLTE